MVYAAFSVNSMAVTPRGPASGGYKLCWRNQRSRRKDIRCEGTNGKGGGGGRRRSAVASWMVEYDLYSLLGVEKTSEGAEIRKAYRALQKRCHPDIAGPEGHNMAILLNQVYSLLSDPASRVAYDRERFKLSEYHGYTGEPIYSRWFGPESEQRAVFVDEVKCIGCLKCALHATKTFAIESTYGRARVVSQWADPEDMIFAAIETCPVDCISIVERSDLAALEFLMSKQPRSSVKITEGNNAGARVANIFEEVRKFRGKFDEMYSEQLTGNVKRKTKNSVMDAIRAISDWMHWQNFRSEESRLSLTSRSSTPPNSEKIREAASKLKATEAAGFSSLPSSGHEHKEDYWEPLLHLSSPSSSSNSFSSSCTPEFSTETINEKNIDATYAEATGHNRTNAMIFGIPLSMAVISATVIGSKGRESSLGHGLQEHIGGQWVLETVNSFELQVILAAITWFFIGLVIATAVGFLVENSACRR